MRPRSRRLARQAGQAVMARTARDDGPDVDHDLVADDVVRVVPVHGARRVPGHQLDGVADPQGRSLGGGEDAVLLVEAGLSFLGLGAQPPTASWGAMLSTGRNYIANAWWVATFPGLSLFLLVLAVNLIGDTVRDRLDPRAQ